MVLKFEEDAISISQETPPRIEFIPLPKIVLISASQPVGSPILRTPIRSSESNKQLPNISYFLEEDSRLELFSMEEDRLIVRSDLLSGEYDLKIKAQALNEQGEAIGEPASHSIHVIVMTGRDKYPVFEQLNYVMEVSIKVTYAFFN